MDLKLIALIFLESHLFENWANYSLELITAICFNTYTSLISTDFMLSIHFLEFSASAQKSAYLKFSLFTSYFDEIRIASFAVALEDEFVSVFSVNNPFLLKKTKFFLNLISAQPDASLLSIPLSTSFALKKPLRFKITVANRFDKSSWVALSAIIFATSQI